MSTAIEAKGLVLLVALFLVLVALYLVLVALFLVSVALFLVLLASIFGLSCTCVGLSCAIFCLSCTFFLFSFRFLLASNAVSFRVFFRGSSAHTDRVRWACMLHPLAQYLTPANIHAVGSTVHILQPELSGVVPRQVLCQFVSVQVVSFLGVAHLSLRVCVIPLPPSPHKPSSLTCQLVTGCYAEHISYKSWTELFFNSDHHHHHHHAPLVCLCSTVLFNENNHHHHRLP